MAVAKKRARKQEEDHPSGDNRYKLVDRTLQQFHFQQDALIEVLHTAQEAFGFLDDGLMIYVAQQLKLPTSWVYGVATFYHFFSLKPQGEHTCVICRGTACYVKGVAEIEKRIHEVFGVHAGETTPDGRLSIAVARCLGSCGLAPVLVVDNDVLGRETPDSTIAVLKDMLAGKRPKKAEAEVEVAELQEAS